MSDQLIQEIEAGMRNLARLGELFHRSARKAVEQKKVEPTFANWCNTLSNKLGGKPGDGAKEALEDLPSDIAAVEDFLHEWKGYEEDKNYKETIEAVKNIRDELRNLHSLWLGASDYEKGEVLAAGLIGRGARGQGNFIRYSLIFVAIVILVAIFLLVKQ
jgi:hypothetical protein